jgi:hypothetical protein
MESPVTRRAKVLRVGLNPIVLMSTETQPSASCSRLLPEAGRNGAEKRYVHHRRTARRSEAYPQPERPRFARISDQRAFAQKRPDMATRRVRAGKAEVRGNLPVAWGRPPRSQFRGDEIPHRRLLLAQFSSYCSFEQ